MQILFSLSKYITPSITWEIIKSAIAYNKISRCLLCLQEKVAIITDPSQHTLLNYKSEIISKCRHKNQHLSQFVLVKCLGQTKFLPPSHFLSTTFISIYFWHLCSIYLLKLPLCPFTISHLFSKHLIATLIIQQNH